MTYYGCGIWMKREDGKTLRYYGEGADPGVSFLSTRFAMMDLEVTVISNTSEGAWPVFAGLMAMI
jgi:hypothetical protein